MGVFRILKHFYRVLPFVAVLSCGHQQSGHLYIVDPKASTLEWTGYKKDGTGNSGTIQVTGHISAGNSGEVTGGEFIMSLSSLATPNMPPGDMGKQLIHHLQSLDFFNMAMYPEITFKLATMENHTGKSGAFTATGYLTFIGRTHPVSFPVTVITDHERMHIRGNATIDRTQWGMTYATDENGNDTSYIRPNVDVQIKLQASKSH